MGAIGSGRKKGTPNKKTDDLFKTAERLGVCPFEIMCMFANEDWEGLGYNSPTMTKVLKDGGTILVDRITPDLRLHAAKEAAKYLYPQRKAVEHSTDEQKGFRIEVIDYVSKDKK